MIIRDANASDLAGVLALYVHLTPNNRPYDKDTAEQIFRRFMQYDGSAILRGKLDGQLVSSCTVVVIPNLTRQGSPYALVENVVTHADYRRLGHGRRMLDAATQRAWDQDCYKIMLMTGSNEPATLRFHAEAGFQQSKTGFQKRRIVGAG